MKYIETEKKISWFSWLPCIWLIVSCSRIGTQWDIQKANDYIEESNFTEGGIEIQITLLLLICLGLYCLFRRKINWGKITKANLWLVLFFLYIGLSIIWSDYHYVSLKRYIKAIGIIIMILVIYTEDYPQLAFSYVLKRVFVFFILTSTTLIFLVPDQGLLIEFTGESTWVGITAHKNMLGQIACLAGIYFFWAITKQGVNKKSTTSMCLFILSMILLLGSQSMTSIIVFIMAVYLFLFFMIKLRPQFLIGVLLFSIIFSGLTFATLDQVVFQGELVTAIFDLMGKDLTFTGRTHLWSDVLQLASDNLWLGVGYGSFWLGNLGNNLWDFYTWTPNQGHNGYIDIIANLGILGLILMICTTCAGFANISSQFSKNYSFARIRMILLVVVLIFNLTESSLCRGTHILWFFYLLVAFNLYYETVRTDQQKK